MVCLATTETVKAALEGFKASGCEVRLDEEAGTATATDGPTRVYWALQKSPGGPWIVRTSDSDRITWK
jgi:hypothetical protein